MFEIALALVPLLALLTSLLFGHYPGHAAIVRLSGRLCRIARARHPQSVYRRPDPPRSHPSSGGLLIALGIAKRPPPLAV